MTDFLDRYAVQFRAAAEAQATRRRRGWRPRAASLAVAGALVVSGGLAVVGVGGDGGPRPDELERPAPAVRASIGGWAEQREILGVLRKRTRADGNPQVEMTLRDYSELRPRVGRLLGLAPSGSAHVLLATRRYPVTTRRDGRLVTRHRRDGLCLVRRGTQGGAGSCLGTPDLWAGRLHGSLAGEIYGLVPDGVTHVRSVWGGHPVRVRRNFYVYRHTSGRNEPAPVWLNERGDEVPKIGAAPLPSSAPPGLAYLNGPGRGTLEDFRGRIVVAGLWASWCDPCATQMRTLQSLQEQLSGQDVVVLGVATRDKAEAAREALERLAISFPVLADPEGRLAYEYSSRAYPHTLVISPDGSIVGDHRGIVDAKDLARSVQRARRER